MRTVYDLMLKVAEKLAEKQVKLRFQHNENCRGLCRVDSSGIVVIDIEPELQTQNEKQFLRTFLHECAHALNDNFIPMSLEASDRSPVRVNAGYKLRETRADLQAEEWLKYAEEHRNIELDWFEGCLWTFLDTQKK